MSRQPVWFISHGGGPSFFMPDRDTFKGLGKGSATEKFFSNDFPKAGPLPKAILVISAHWEEKNAVVTAAKDHNEQIYDYYGFPDETYKLDYTPPGDIALSERVRDLVNNVVPTTLDAKRGLDHGTWIPLRLAWPKANIPVVQLSLLSNFDPALHIKVGEALRPLREEGVLIIGSGFVTHDLNTMIRGHSNDQTHGKRLAAFREALLAVATAPEAERNKALVRWEALPHAKDWHPREEHLLPMMVAAGAAGDDRGQARADEYVLQGRAWSCMFLFGA